MMGAARRGKVVRHLEIVPDGEVPELERPAAELPERADGRTDLPSLEVSEPSPLAPYVDEPQGADSSAEELETAEPFTPEPVAPALAAAGAIDPDHAALKVAAADAFVEERPVPEVGADDVARDPAVVDSALTEAAEPRIPFRDRFWYMHAELQDIQRTRTWKRRQRSLRRLLKPLTSLWGIAIALAAAMLLVILLIVL